MILSYQEGPPEKSSSLVAAAGRYTIQQPCLEPWPRFQEIHEDTHQSIIWFGHELLASELYLEAYFSLSPFNTGVLRHGGSHLNLSINELFG